jgi:hypothetical protein
MTNLPRIKQLRSLIDLNFCEKDKVLYRQIIEPGIKAIVKEYWLDWNEIEWQITIIITLVDEVYKNPGNIVISFDSPEEVEQYRNEMNVDRFQEIKQKNFKWKINYLKKKGILHDYTYRLLDILREKRNRIHSPLTSLSEQDLIDFSYGSYLVNRLWQTMFHKLDESTVQKIRKEVEEQAKSYYSSIKN